MGRKSSLSKRLRRVLNRKMKPYTYLPSEVPTTEELQKLEDSRKRVLLVIKIRWAMLAVFALYGLYASFFYRIESPDRLTTAHVVIPALAFALAVGYNAWYHYSYRWFAKLRHLNLAQMLVDLVYVTLVIHFSGGAVSWVWAMYPVLILQASFLGESARDSWIIGGAASLFYGGLLTTEFYGIVPPVSVPFENGALQQNFGYEMLKWAWVSTICLIISGIGSHMITEIKNHERKLQKMVVMDGHTEIYNRAYFYLRLNSEIHRAVRYGRSFSLLVMDVDNFKRFNDSYGHHAGDVLLKGVAGVLRNNIRRSDTHPRYDVDIPCRIGGEEFAVILPEANPAQSRVAAERLRESIEAHGAAETAERIRRSVESLDIEGKKVTVSIGVASFPEHGNDADGLFKMADDAMYRAKRQGKNRVVVAGDMAPKEDARDGKAGTPVGEEQPVLA
jgi:diguanylate cyclase (GGDEF)-like protein